MFKLAYLKTVETVENTKRKNIFKDLVNAFKQFYVYNEERLWEDKLLSQTCESDDKNTEMHCCCPTY